MIEKNQPSKLSTLTRGIIKENPVLVLVLGTCPTLATTTSVSTAIGMGIAVSKALEGIARQPESEKKLFKTLMIGLVFLETCIIYALLVVIFVIFVL